MAFVHTAPDHDLLGPRFSGREFALWASAAVIIVSAHAGSVWALNRMQPQEQAAAEAAPVAVMIDLAPEVVAPNATPDEMVDLLESIETAALETPPEEVKPTETPPLEPVPVEAEQQPPVEPAPVEPVVEEVIPETIPDLLPEVAMAPVARPDVVEPLPEPKPKPKPKPVRKAPPKVERKAPPPSVSRQVTAKPAPKAAAPRPVEGGASNGVSPARWQSRVNAHLNRHKRFPGGERGEGTVSVRFTIDSLGRVLGASVSRSSGSAALDQAALDMVRRASPVPAPPPAIAKSHMSLNVPVRFSRR
jgi:protein TonB